MFYSKHCSNLSVLEFKLFMVWEIRNAKDRGPLSINLGQEKSILLRPREKKLRSDNPTLLFMAIFFLFKRYYLIATVIYVLLPLALHLIERL